MSLPDLSALPNSESPTFENAEAPRSATTSTAEMPAIFRAQTMRNNAAVVNAAHATPVLIGSGHNLLARYNDRSVRLSFHGPSRFSVECSACKPRDTDVHLFNCVHGWSTLLHAFKVDVTHYTHFSSSNSKSHTPKHHSISYVVNLS